MQRWTGNSSFANTIVNSKANRCLDARDPDLNNPNSLTNGTRIELWDCWGGPMQAWYRTAAPMPVNCFFFRISGLFLVRYLEMRGSERLGCPAGPEMNHPDGGDGRYQTFDGGAMAYSPNTGPNSVQMGYGGARFLGLLWSTTDPFTYDKFIVRYDRDGQNIGQDDIAQQTIPNNAGSWMWNLADGRLSPGLYRLVVEGCDVTNTGGNDCKQGFSLPVYIRVP